MYRIRFHGRGGQGMKTASRILGSAFFREGYEVQDAPRYGAERRGAPIFAYVRAAQRPIQERGAIAQPDLVVVADETLTPIPAAGVLAGASARTVLLINSAESEDAWKARLNYPGRIIRLPGGGELRERAQTATVGAACAGAAARLVGRISREALALAVDDEIAALGSVAAGTSRDRALAAYDALEFAEACVTEDAAHDARGYAAPEWVELAAEAARAAAPDIHGAATSVEVRTGLWRTLRPVIDYDHCKGCTWVCGTLCPDSAIQVDAEGAPRIDYAHCKGCLVCVAVCPPHAIRAIPEKDAQQPQEATA
jgi:pyruvate ferredoxin oxidoreductase gamma subunit